MVAGYTNNYSYNTSPSFSAKKAKILDKPIENVQNVIESGVDSFIDTTKEDEKRRKVRKRAIAASSTVLVVGALTMLLNPRSSGKFGEKLAEFQKNLNHKIKVTKEGSIKKTFYSYWNKILNGFEKAGNLYFNFNSFKDWAWDALCTNGNKKYPKFLTKNKTCYDIVKALDDGFVKVFRKPTEAITKWFDNISKNTVKNKYKKALKEMESLEVILKAYKDKLPSDRQAAIDKKLAEIIEAKKAFNEENVSIRLLKQEELMSGLKNDFANKLYNKKDGWCKDKTKFWARDILIPQKNKVEQEGAELVEKLFGNDGKKGLYDETLDIFKGHLDEKQLKNLEKEMSNAKNKINKAKISECYEYFDKKRDLVLGGAPTDILTQIFGLGLCGVIVTKADKEDRWSKLFTNGVPIITGLLSSLVFSAKLYAGAKSLLAGAAVTVATDSVCDLINKHVFGNKDDDEEDNKESVTKNQKTVEVQNA